MALAANTLALYFDDTKCVSVTDDATGSHNLSQIGTVSYDTSSAPPVGTKAVYGFNGSNYLQQVSTLCAALIATQNSWTIEAYVNPVAADYQSLLTSYGTNWQYIGQDFSNTLIRTHWENNTAVNGATNIGTGWHHIAITWDGSFGRYYIDNVLDPATPDATSRTWLSTGGINIGVFFDGGSFPYGGYINQLRFSSGAKTSFPTVDPEPIPAAQKIVGGIYLIK